MSETAPAYAPDTATDTGGTWHHWRCRDCGKEMWVVVDGNAQVDGKAILPGSSSLPVKVQCPHCGFWNTWNNHDN
jgi:phage terminase large subunit GpA-like protein